MKAGENPFRTDRVLALRYRPRDETLEQLLDRLHRIGYRAAIVGPHGTGKTTLLEDIEPELRVLGFRTKLLHFYDKKRRFRRGEMKRFFAELTRQEFILLDGTEQMSALQWQWFKVRSKKAGGLLITAHKKGMLPTLTECATSPELLEEIISELLIGETPCVPVGAGNCLRRIKAISAACFERCTMFTLRTRGKRGFTAEHLGFRVIRVIGG